MKNKLTLIFMLCIGNALAAESSNLVIETDNETSNTVMESNNKAANNQIKKTKTTKKHYSKSRKKSHANINEINFDYTYSGDLAGALVHLQEYDFSLRIAPYLGKKQSVNVSVDLQNTNLDQLISVLNSQAEGYGTIQYNPSNNGIKIIYTSKIRDIGYDAMMESKKWREGHKPKPIITPDGVLQYPYGFYQPVIPCKIGMICDIRLGPGEVLMDWAISDMGNWQMYSKKSGRGDGSAAEPSLAFSGSGDNLIPHILIKPTAAATTTNLVVLTNKRTYDMLLKATNSDYVLSAGFYFPNMMMQGVEDEKQKLRERVSNGDGSGDADANAPDSAYNVNMSALNYNDYEISGDDVSWKPTAVIDDGEKVWIKFANGNQISPILVETNPDNPSQPYKLIRYFPQPGNMYLVNRMFDEAMLLVGINDQTKIVYIKRKKAEKSFFKKLFGSTS